LLDPESAAGQWPYGVSFVEKNEGDEVRYRTVDITPALRQPGIVVGQSSCCRA
jgi:hypothetical protein